MKTCRICGDEIPWYIRFPGQPRRVYKRKICLKCLPYRPIREYTLNRLCIDCHTEKPLEKFYAVSGNLCIECFNLRIHRKKINLKKEAIAYRGGRCVRCGYNRVVQALHFHHRDRRTKEFLLSNRIGGLTTKLKFELDKCDLLCANCHSEITAIENMK